MMVNTVTPTTACDYFAINTKQARAKRSRSKTISTTDPIRKGSLPCPVALNASHALRTKMTKLAIKEIE